MQRTQNNKKMQAQARTGVRATAPMHVPVAVSCCFKNILAPEHPYVQGRRSREDASGAEERTEAAASR